MYSVMLVDDEKLILQGLMNIIDWEGLGLRIVETSQNGYEALEKFKKISVDIIVTDINMPRLTGLELIKEIRSINSKTKFVILTGYDEFTYAKEAIKYGVESYILKPINEEELEEALIGIVKYLNDKKQEKNKILDKNSKLIEYIEGKFNESYIYEMQDLISIEVEEKAYTVANIIIEKENNGGEHININNIIEKYTIEKYEVLHRYSNQTIIINSWDKNTCRNEIIKYYEEIKDHIISKLNEGVFISIGDTVFDIKNLKKSYNISNELKKYILTEGTNKCVYSEKVKIERGSSIDFKEEIECINKLIIEKNNKELEKYICNILDNKELNPKNIYDFSIKVIILVDNIANEFKFNQKYGKDSLSNTIIQLSNESTRESVKAFIIREVEELVETMYINSIKYSPVVQQIISIINDKYYEELSLKTLASQYNINSSYLGQIFSKETGSSFSEYLNKTRNMKAKELILNTNMKINDISKEIGYTDTSYFYRKFKKHYGVSPSTLREMKNY